MIALAYIGAASLGIGMLAALIAIIRTLREEVGLGGAVCGTLIGAPLLGGLGFVTVASIRAWDSPTLATLSKSEWACVARHYETTMVLAGKVLVPVTRPICDTYARR